MKKLLIVSISLLIGLPGFAKPLGQGTIKVKLRNNILVFDKFTISFQRTLRIPDDGKSYPLPPSLGEFPIYRVQNYAKKLPKEWVKKGGVFIPMYQREAMWISFGGEHWRPRAVKIGTGNVNVINGEKWSPDLKKKKGQNYLVAPNPQPWLDGIKVGKNLIRQFVAMPLGQGYTVAEQVKGGKPTGGLQIAVFNPKKGKFKKPDEPPGYKKYQHTLTNQMAELGEMGMGTAAGGKMKQKIYPDPHGMATWDPNQFAIVNIYIVNSEMFKKITGKNPPESAITKKEYEIAGYPWFALYDEKFKDVKSKKKLRQVKSIRQIDKKKGVKDPDEKSMTVKKVIKYKVPGSEEKTTPKRKTNP